MDENEIVVHQRRCSTAVGVTPSHPSAIVDLFHEMESIASGYAAGGSDSDDGENDDDSGRPGAPTAHSNCPRGGPAPSFGPPAPSVGSADAAAILAGESLESAAMSSSASTAYASASASGGEAPGKVQGKQEQEQQPQQRLPHSGPAVKLWDSRKSATPNDTSAAATTVATPTTTGSVTRTEVGGVVSSTPQQEAAAAAAATAAAAPGSGGAPSPKFTTMFAPSSTAEVWEGQAPKPYWPADANKSPTAAAATAAAVEAAAEAAAADVVGKAGVDGAVIVLPDETPNQPVRTTSSVQDPEDLRRPSLGVRQQRPLPAALSRLSSVSGSGMSLAPLRRKTSMGSFQKGMGESLKGRMRKQMDIPLEPKSEIDLNIPIDQITSLKYLAQGAMCVAYTAVLYGKTVVLKTPLPDTSHADVAANDLEVEMLLLKELHHEHIVGLLGAGFLPDGRRFVALEYLSGGTLSDVLRDRRSTPMGMTQVLDLALSLCNALEYLHDCAVPGRIVCHRDLKPDNIGFAEDGSLKVIDFGLGKIIKRKFRVRAERYQMTGGTGSLRYMAPEVADHQEYNEKGDVYSFSLIMWEMLAGEKPFLGLKRPEFYSRVVDKGERPPLNPEWPLPVRNLLEECWRTNLDERLSFREVAGILKVCAEEENQKKFTEERRKSVRVANVRSKLWTTTGARPDLEQISADPQYKPKFTISSFFSHHNNVSSSSSCDVSRPITFDKIQTMHREQQQQQQQQQQPLPLPPPPAPPFAAAKPQPKQAVGVVGRRRLNFWSMLPSFRRKEKLVKHDKRRRGGRITV